MGVIIIFLVEFDLMNGQQEIFNMKSVFFLIKLVLGVFLEFKCLSSNDSLNELASYLGIENFDHDIKDQY